MWSGDNQYSQWALNPSAYQNISHEEVDWAALAQQWIQMKETLPANQIPPAPPPPPPPPPVPDKAECGEKKRDLGLEGGEAPMDMDTKDEAENSSSSNAPESNSWGVWPNWQQWGWNWGTAGGMVPPGGVPPPNQSLVTGKGTTSTGSVAVHPYGFTHNSQTYNSSTGVYDYNHAAGSEHYGQVVASGYWTSGGPADTGPETGPSPFLRQNRQDWRRSNRSHDRIRTTEKSDDEEDATPVLDAAKRRQLPAWIREGLEKMEREKQKKIDRERQIKEREEYLQKKREEEENAINELEKNSGQPVIPKKSKFESDSEESTHGESPSHSQSLKRKSRFRNADSPNSSPRHPSVRLLGNEPEPPKSREEVMQDIMLKVRRILTEILLEVTTEEMEAVAQEVLSKAKAKGLGMYGDSEDSDSGDEAAGNISSQANGADSDEELRDQIQKRKMAFMKTEREIEARLQEEEEQEKERERRMMGEESDDSEREERQVEKQTDSKHPAEKGSEEEGDQDRKPKVLHPQDSIKHEDKLQNASSRDLCTSVVTNRKSSHDEGKSERNADNPKLDRKIKQSPGRGDTSPLHHKKSEKSSVSSEENYDETSSKSNSYSSSTSGSSSSSRSSSSTSRRSSKKSSKSGRNTGGSRRQEKKRNGSNSHRRRSCSRDGEYKKSDKMVNSCKDRSREMGDRDRKGKDRKDRQRGRSSRSRSRSRSDTSRSRDGNDRRKSKDDRWYSSRHESDYRSRKSRDSERRNSSSSSSKPRAYRHKQESRSPVSRKSKKLSKGKRLTRHSSGSSSPSSSKRQESHRGNKRGKYSRSRSSSLAPSKKSRHRRRSSSSSHSAQSIERERPLGKKSGHSRNN